MEASKVHVAIVVFSKIIVIFCSLTLTLSGYIHSRLITVKAKNRSISFLVTRDAQVFEGLRRVFVICLLFVNFVYLMFQVFRVFNNFPPYADTLTEVLSILTVVLLFVMSSIVYVLYTPKASEWVSKQIDHDGFFLRVLGVPKDVPLEVDLMETKKPKISEQLKKV